jgi:hypothetical protein
VSDARLALPMSDAHLAFPWSDDLALAVTATPR